MRVLLAWLRSSPAGGEGGSRSEPEWGCFDENSRVRNLAIAAVSAVALAGLAWAAFEALDRAFPPPLPQKLAVSNEVVDRDGALLRAFATPTGAGGSRSASTRSIRNSSRC